MINILGAVVLTVALLLGFLWCIVRLQGVIVVRNTLAEPAVERINNVLPQTQCGQCGYAGCLPYAQAIAEGENINRCPPGGSQTIRRLAKLLDLPEMPLDVSHGWHLPKRVAVIREQECIGCTKCIQACPVDAIVGAPKLMHTVITADCTGCDLCVDPCPVDCIDMLAVAVPGLSTIRVVNT